jgi:hypothetical protein
LSQKPSLRHVAVVLTFFVSADRGAAHGGADDSSRPADREALRIYARGTWKSVAAMAEGLELPADGLRRLPNGSWRVSPKTTPTDIACYLWSTVAAQRLGIISEAESLRRLGGTLSALERMERVHGFFLDWIDPQTGRTLRRSPYDRRMIMAAIANALADDAIRHAFSDGPVDRAIRPLIEPEEFTAGEDAPAPRSR